MKETFHSTRFIESTVSGKPVKDEEGEGKKEIHFCIPIRIFIFNNESHFIGDEKKGGKGRMKKKVVYLNDRDKLR